MCVRARGGAGHRPRQWSTSANLATRARPSLATATRLRYLVRQLATSVRRGPPQASRAAAPCATAVHAVDRRRARHGLPAARGGGVGRACIRLRPDRGLLDAGVRRTAPTSASATSPTALHRRGHRLVARTLARLRCRAPSSIWAGAWECGGGGRTAPACAIWRSRVLGRLRKAAAANVYVRWCSATTVGAVDRRRSRPPLSTGRVVRGTSLARPRPACGRTHGGRAETHRAQDGRRSVPASRPCASPTAGDHRGRHRMCGSRMRCRTCCWTLETDLALARIVGRGGGKAGAARARAFAGAGRRSRDRQAIGPSSARSPQPPPVLRSSPRAGSARRGGGATVSELAHERNAEKLLAPAARRRRERAPAPRAERARERRYGARAPRAPRNHAWARLGVPGLRRRASVVADAGSGRRRLGLGRAAVPRAAVTLVVRVESCAREKGRRQGGVRKRGAGVVRFERRRRTGPLSDWPPRAYRGSRSSWRCFPAWGG